MAPIFSFDVAIRGTYSIAPDPSSASGEWTGDPSKRREFEEVTVRSSVHARVWPIAIALLLAAIIAPAGSRAALDMVVGGRQVVKNEPVSACNSKARAALNSVFLNAAEVGSGDTGEWKAFGDVDSSGHSFSAGAIHCYPLDDSYLVTFTCAAQAPPSPDTAAALCTKLEAAFNGGRSEASTSKRGGKR